MTSIFRSRHIKDDERFAPPFELRAIRETFSTLVGSLPGSHLILDLVGSSNLSEPMTLETILVGAALAAGANVLFTKMHHFGEGGGVTGVVLLAESHISIHTWPENEAACVDIFMCGTMHPEISAKYIVDALAPSSVVATEILRHPGHEDEQDG